MTQYQARHRLLRTNYCRGCGTALHHLTTYFCEKKDCQAIRKSWRHLRLNYRQKQWRSTHLDRDREINRQSHRLHAEKRNARARVKYWANPAVRQYYRDYAHEYYRKKIAA